MKIKALIASAILATAAPISASAAQLTDGLYAASDTNYDETRSVYGFSAIEGLSHFWSFAADAALIVNGGGTAAQLVGTIQNIADKTVEMAVNISLTQISGTSPGFCQFFGAHDKGCNSTETLGLIANGDIDPSLWNFFDINAGSSISGLGSLAGLSYAITDKTNSMHPAQIGEDANALQVNDQNGGSFWFNWNRTSDISVATNYISRSGGSGDFNFNLATDPDGNLNDVPLPAAGWLLIAAFGGLAAAKRRKA